MEKKKARGIALQLVLFFIVAISVPTLLLALTSIKTTRTALKNNMKLTSEQTLQETQKGFSTYLRTLSQPIDLLTRKDQVKHLEDKGVLEDNVTAIQDSLVASVKVTDSAVRCYYSTKNGIMIKGWLENVDGKATARYSYADGMNKTSQAWYKDCIGLTSRNGIYANFTNPYTDPETGNKIFTVSQEIKDSSKANYGTVAMDIEFSAVEEYVQNIGLLNTGFVILADKDGNIIVNNDKNSYVSGNIANYSFWQKAQDDVAENTSQDGTTIEKSIFTYTEEINNDNVQVVVMQDIVTGWKLIGMIGDSETAPTVNTIKDTVIVSGIIAFVVGILIAIFVTLMFVSEINKVNVAMKAVADGDLTHRIKVKRHDEFGVLENRFNEMVQNISGLIKNVEVKTNTIVTAADNISEVSKATTDTTSQVSEAIQSVSIGAVGQAESTQNANQEVDNLAEKLNATKAYVDDINDMSEDAKKLSNRGIRIVEELIEKADKSKSNSKLSKDVVSEMVSSIEKINFISDAITQITEQTNLLSLNASIEAARAGESGRGFAVVADEIRKLAEQSQQSTDEIKQIVGEISAKSSVVEKTLDESDDIINEQNKAIEDTKELFNNISDSINALTEGLQNIGKLNKEMDSNCENVVEKMEEVSNISNDTAAASQEVTASVEEVNATMQTLNQYTLELNDIAETLKEAIEIFKL